MTWPLSTVPSARQRRHRIFPRYEAYRRAGCPLSLHQPLRRVGASWTRYLLNECNQHFNIGNCQFSFYLLLASFDNGVGLAVFTSVWAPSSIPPSPPEQRRLAGNNLLGRTRSCLLSVCSFKRRYIWIVPRCEVPPSQRWLMKVRACWAAFFGGSIGVPTASLHRYGTTSHVIAMLDRIYRVDNVVPVTFCEPAGNARGFQLWFVPAPRQPSKDQIDTAVIQFLTFCFSLYSLRTRQQFFVGLLWLLAENPGLLYWLGSLRWKYKLFDVVLPFSCCTGTRWRYIFYAASQRDYSGTDMAKHSPGPTKDDAFVSLRWRSLH